MGAPSQLIYPKVHKAERGDKIYFLSLVYELVASPLFPAQIVWKHSTPTGW